jgi:hypothetical protein
MYVQAMKTKEDKKKTVAYSIARMQSGSGSTFQFADDRPEAVQILKLQDTANNTPQAKQTAQLQTVAYNYNTQQPQTSNPNIIEARAIQRKAPGTPSYKRGNSNNMIIQCEWIGDDYPKRWNELLDGAQWFTDAEGAIWYTAEDLPKDHFFQKYAGEKNKRTYEQWNLVEFQLNTQLSEHYGYDASKKRVYIDDKAVGPTVIHSASDLLIWFVGHREAPENTPKNFAEPDTMVSVLKLLDNPNKVFTRAEVWDALRTIVPLNASHDEPSSDDDDDAGVGFWASSKEPVDESGDEADLSVSGSSSAEHTGENHDWALGFWRAEEKTGLPIPAEFRREIPGNEMERLQAELDQKLHGCKLVGFHATGIENVGSLITYGVSAGKMGSGHGLGKGPGFYIVPVLSGTTIKSTKQMAMLWGNLVAVFAPIDIQVFDASDTGENVDELAGEHANCMFFYGKDELVIPTNLFSRVLLVRNVNDIAMNSDPRFRAIPSDDPVSTLHK